jgi:hemerythrin-like domain-containing protein
MQQIPSQIVAQHHKLDQMVAVLGRAISNRLKPDARNAFGRFRTALSAHFALEQQFFLPLAHGAVGHERREVERLVVVHERLTEELAQMSEQLELLAPEDFSRRLNGFATALATHVNREEALLSSVLEGRAS